MQFLSVSHSETVRQLRSRISYPALPFLECVDAFPELTGMDQ